MAIELILEQIKAGKEVSLEVRSRNDREIDALEASLRALRPRMQVFNNRHCQQDNSTQFVTRMKLLSTSNGSVLAELRRALERTSLPLELKTHE